MKRFSATLLLLCLTLIPTTSLIAAEFQKLPDVHDWYGVYLQGKKVGALELTKSRSGGLLTTQQRMVARIKGMGQEVSMTIEDEHVFDLAKGTLLRLSFRQLSSTGSVEILGEVVDGRLQLKVKAGGETRMQSAIANYRADDFFAAELLAINSAAPIKTLHQASLFDASIQKNTLIQSQLVRRERKLFDGVSTEVRFIRQKYPDLGIEAESIYTSEGRMLESQMGGLFKVRLEDQKRAQDIGYSEDILISFAVPSSKPITDPSQVRSLKARLQGIGSDFVIPSTHRQRVTGRDARGITLQVTSEKIGSDITLPVRASDFISTLAPENLLQSDAPEIRAKAKAIVGAEKSAFKASEKLLQWVYRHVQKAYVPAVSNALEVLHSLRGDCGEHTALFVALARAAGIPARPVVGITYWPPVNGFGYHAWAEVFIGEWHAVDPTQGTMAVDATHIQLASSDLMDQARLTALMGKLKVEIE